MNQAFNMHLEMKPAMTQPKKPAPSKVDKPAKDSDFRKELENATTTKQPENKAEGTMPQMQKPSAEKPSIQPENGALQQEDTIDLQNVAAMMAATMMPMVLVPEENVQVMPEETAPMAIDPTLTTLVPEQQTQLQGEMMQTAPLMQQTEETPVEQQVKPVEVHTEQQQTATVEQQVKPEHKTAAHQETVTVSQGQDERIAVVTEASAAIHVERPLFDKVEATPIQVAQPVRADQPEFPVHLAARIDNAAMQGQNTIEVQLTPYELGKITIRLTVTEDGTQISMHSTNSKTVRLLAEHAANIGAIIEQNQQGPVSVSVEQEQSQYTQQEHHGNGQQQQQQQERRQDHPKNDDFIQQLRLGLAGLS